MIRVSILRRREQIPGWPPNENNLFNSENCNKNAQHTTKTRTPSWIQNLKGVAGLTILVQDFINAASHENLSNNRSHCKPFMCLLRRSDFTAPFKYVTAVLWARDVIQPWYSMVVHRTPQHCSAQRTAQQRRMTSYMKAEYFTRANNTATICTLLPE